MYLLSKTTFLSKQSFLAVNVLMKEINSNYFFVIKKLLPKTIVGLEILSWKC